MVGKRDEDIIGKQYMLINSTNMLSRLSVRGTVICHLRSKKKKQELNPVRHVVCNSQWSCMDCMGEYELFYRQ